MSIKIIDCFIFYNELELLTYRLNILNEFVDYFILVESTHTFTGKQKILYYNENKNLFEKFNKKIIHIIVNDFPHKYPYINIQYNEQWINEHFQRNCISRGLYKINNLSYTDVIIIADLDEIPDPNVLDSVKNGKLIINMNTLLMDMYYYNLNTKHENKWSFCKIITYQNYLQIDRQCNKIRNINCIAIKNGGWHLSYFGNQTYIKNKINHFSHQEFNNNHYTDIKKIEDRIKNNKDPFDRNYVITKKIEICDNTYLPPDYNIYLNNYYT